MYKIVAVDLDGTMLNSYGIVTENTKDEIKKVIENGTDVIYYEPETYIPQGETRKIADDVWFDDYQGRWVEGNDI